MNDKNNSCAGVTDSCIKLKNEPQAETPGKVRVGVYGATGTTGVELATLLRAHPFVELIFGTTREFSGHTLSEIDPNAPDLLLQHPGEVDPERIDLAFLCLPHGASAPMAENLYHSGTAVIDLSGDLRIKDETVHQQTYGSPRSRELVEKTVYGLPEFSRETPDATPVVSNPGCYATAVELGLLPLAEARILPKTVYVNALSGVSGAGRAATPTTHFCSANEDVRPYKVGRVHRHIPEMEQTLRAAGADIGFRIVFSPHLVPLERGILATSTVIGSSLAAEKARHIYRNRFKNEPFIKVHNKGDHARIRGVAHTNRCAISIESAEDCDTLLITSAIDNLGKGAAGQAIQNMNRLCGFSEQTGLRGYTSHEMTD